MLKPSDIYVLSGLLTRGEGWTYRTLASDLHVPHPVVQRALSRADAAGLYVPANRAVHVPHFEEFVTHGLRYLAPGALGEVVPGIPAAWAAAPVSNSFSLADEELPPVWPEARGRVRGQALQPLHDAARKAVVDSPPLGELLAIVDSIRAGDLRVRSVASDLLAEKLRDGTRRRQP